jgi:hypothetical protein
VRRSILLAGGAAAVLFGGLTTPTTAEGPLRLAPVADYLHEVVRVAPPLPEPLPPLVARVDAATARPTCESLRPPLRGLRPAAERALADPATSPAADKVLAQLVSYGQQVEQLCG